MKKKVLIILGIILVVIIVLGIITNYVDSGRVGTGHEPKYCIKYVSYDGSKVTYLGLGYKVIRYVGISPNEPYENNIGVKMGSWFMKYELPKSNVIEIEHEGKTITITDIKDIQTIENILVNSKYNNGICKGINTHKIKLNNESYYIKEDCKEIQKGNKQAIINAEDLETINNIISSYKTNNEQNISEYEKITTLKANNVSTTELVKFNGILYGKSYGEIDYAGGSENVGVIDKLIDSKYVPKYDCETNTKEILNALVYDPTERTLVLNYNNEYVLFEKIEINSNIETSTFTRTYNVLNVSDSNDEKYLYLTIKQFQEEEVTTVKVQRSLANVVEQSNSYEFTFQYTDNTVEDNIESIFANTILISIKKTDKQGLEQIQDLIR